MFNLWITWRAPRRTRIPQEGLDAARVELRHGGRSGRLRRPGLETRGQALHDVFRQLLHQPLLRREVDEAALAERLQGTRGDVAADGPEIEGAI